MKARAAWRAPRARSNRREAEPRRWPSREHLRLQQSQREIDEEPERHDSPDRVEQRHGVLLQPFTQADQRPGEREESHGHSQVDDIGHHTASPWRSSPAVSDVAPPSRRSTSSSTAHFALSSSRNSYRSVWEISILRSVT